MLVQDEFSEDQEGMAGWRSIEVATASLDSGSIAKQGPASIFE